jgi:hypothetical protein
MIKMDNFQKDRRFFIFKSCSVFALFVVAILLVFTGVSSFHLARCCPWIPGWVINTVNTASDVAGVVGICAMLAAAGGIGAVVAPLVVRYDKKHGLKCGLAM